MKWYFCGHAPSLGMTNCWSGEYDYAARYTLEQAAAELLNNPACSDENGTMTVLSPDAGAGVGWWIIIRVMDPDLE